jgi:hypothetical protein
MGVGADFESNVVGAIFGFVGFVSGTAGGLYVGAKIGSYTKHKLLSTVLLDIVLVPVCAIPTAIYSAKIASNAYELLKPKPVQQQDDPKLTTALIE